MSEQVPSNTRVAALRHLHDKLKSGEYDGTDVMAAWIAVEDLACLLERATAEPCHDERVKSLCDRIDQIHAICCDRAMSHAGKVREIEGLSIGFAPIPPCSQCGKGHAEPEQNCPNTIFPIAKLTVRDGLAVRAGLYAPGLPDGDHDVYPAASSQPPAPEWQPIETAPRDGTPILVSNEERDGAWIAYYCPVYQSGYRPENPWSSLMLNTRWHKNTWASYVPTRWMTIPLPYSTVTKEAARCPCWDVWRTHCQGLIDCRANQQGASPETGDGR